MDNTHYSKSLRDALESTPDEFVPHGLNLERLHLAPDAVFVNLCDMTPVPRISDRISRAAMRCKGGATATCVLKIARFKHKAPALQREVSVYSTLSSCGFTPAPKFMGLVYEGKTSRTVGFLMEEISGRHPNMHDLDACMQTVRRLHTFGIIHGDINKHNILITAHGAKVFDFEFFVYQGEVDDAGAAAEEELNTLADKLEDRRVRDREAINT